MSGHQLRASIKFSVEIYQVFRPFQNTPKWKKNFFSKTLPIGALWPSSYWGGISLMKGVRAAPHKYWNRLLHWPSYVRNWSTVSMLAQRNVSRRSGHDCWAKIVWTSRFLKLINCRGTEFDRGHIDVKCQLFCARRLSKGAHVSKFLN